MVKKYDIKVLVLTEVRISGMVAVRKIKQIGFSDHLKQDANGFSGGIWVIWNKNEAELSLLATHKQFIHVKIKWAVNKMVELATFVYGSPRRAGRRLLWEELNNISLSVNKLWIVLGDFNAVSQHHEKKGGNDACQGSMREFNDCLASCDLSDIGFKGSSFTWKRGRLLERLDRVVSNTDWVGSCPQRFILHLPFLCSDHRPLLLWEGKRHSQGRANRTFKFLASWLHCDGFDDLVKRCWPDETKWDVGSTTFQHEATLWNDTTFEESM
ncbi:uncharacterized protein LOC133288056 [Gastrolobium bilobum]|uniref:uncharacterized protein LOC133288056 n=1 Tax=Gastrolobium bilobum TaxID=150636 RepID=UPI002AB3196F|nr:uncharacterized protein LOC133288056 [Gastrolobium bilobum]